jgi:hypothetical protein
METVEAAWTSVPARPCPLETLSLKLKATERRLQSWSQKSVGHLNSQLFLAKEILHQLDIAQDSRTLQPNELWLRNNLKKHSFVLASLLRTVARIRSRINCWCRTHFGTKRSQQLKVETTKLIRECRGRNKRHEK